MDKPLIIVGGGGHARVLMDILLGAGAPLLGYMDPVEPAEPHPEVPWLGGDGVIQEHAPDAVLLVNGMGSTRDTEPRSEIFLRFAGLGYRFAEVIHPRAILGERGLTLGQGVQILAGAVVNTGSRLGSNVLVNTRAVVEHDCDIGDHCHIATGAVLCGGCRLGAGVHVGAGATVIQGITIGAEAILAAGCVVTRDVEPLTLVAGIPASQKRQYG